MGKSLQSAQVYSRVASQERHLSVSGMLFLSIARLLQFALAFTFSVIRAQIIHTTPLWDTNVTSSHSDRVNAADAALSQVVNRLDNFGRLQNDLNTGHTLRFYEALANFNMITHQQNLSETTMGYFHQQLSVPVLVYTANNGDVVLRNIIQQGYTAMRTYLSLGDDYYLEKAKECWEIMNVYTISESDLQSGKSSVKNFFLPQICEPSLIGNYSLGGGVFQNGSNQSSVIDLYETAYFFLFSSVLASSETPPNSTYVSAARASLDFVMQTNFTQAWGDNLIAEWSCGNISFIWPGGTSIVGFLIEGLSFLPVLENDKNLYKLLLQTIQQTFNRTGSGWPNPKGTLLNYHIQAGSQDPELLPDAVVWDIEFVRGLAVAYRNIASLPLDVRDAIKTFLGVQYNAVRNLASIGGNLYDGSWQDPSTRTYCTISTDCSWGVTCDHRHPSVHKFMAPCDQ